MPNQQSKKPIEKKAETSFNLWGEVFTTIKRTQVQTWYGILVIGLITGAIGALIWSLSFDLHSISKAATGDISTSITVNAPPADYNGITYYQVMINSQLHYNVTFTNNTNETKTFYTMKRIYNWGKTQILSQSQAYKITVAAYSSNSYDLVQDFPNDPNLIGKGYVMAYPIGSSLKDIWDVPHFYIGVVDEIVINCSDSDGGKDYFTQGTTIGYDSYGGDIDNVATYSDQCDGADRVMEFFCEYQNDPHGGAGYVAMENIPCEYGCGDGSCFATSTISINFSANHESGTFYYTPQSPYPVPLKFYVTAEKSDGTPITFDYNDRYYARLKIKEEGESDFTDTGGMTWLEDEQRYMRGNFQTLPPGTHDIKVSIEKTWGVPLEEEIIQYTMLERECAESDNGKDFNIKGVTSGYELTDYENNEYVLGNYSDSCIDASTLQEYYCASCISGCPADPNKNWHIVMKENTVCPNGCQDGACKVIACQDSDGGSDYFTKGTTITPTGTTHTDYCSEPYTPASYLYEFICLNDYADNMDVIKCEYGCVDGECQQGNNMTLCSDADGGFNINTAGTLNFVYNGESYNLEDSCYDKNLSEIVCGSNIPEIYTVYCKNSCSNGACNDENVVADCLDSDNGSYDIQGTTSAGVIEKTDYCWGNYMYEFHCTDDKTYMYSERYLCPNGCQDGACNK